MTITWKQAEEQRAAMEQQRRDEWHESAILEQYRVMGREPVRGTTGMLITASLVKQIKQEEAA